MKYALARAALLMVALQKEVSPGGSINLSLVSATKLSNAKHNSRFENDAYNPHVSSIPGADG
jgi:hypothetical protein